MGNEEEKWKKLYQKYEKKPSVKKYWKFVLTIIALGLISFILYYFYLRIPSITIENFASSLTNLTSNASYRIWLYSLGKGNCYWLTSSPLDSEWQLELWKFSNTTNCTSGDLINISYYTLKYPINLMGKSCLCYSRFHSVEIEAKIQEIRAGKKLINIVVK